MKHCAVRKHTDSDLQVPENEVPRVVCGTLLGCRALAWPAWPPSSNLGLDCHSHGQTPAPPAQDLASTGQHGKEAQNNRVADPYLTPAHHLPAHPSGIGVEVIVTVSID